MLKSLSGLSVRFWLRFILGTLFCVSSIAKLSAIEGFDLYLFSFLFFPFDLCSLAARLLIAAEFALGLGLMISSRRKLFNWLGAASLLIFSLFLIWRIILGDRESCHCFGEIVDMNPLQSLLKNALMLVLLAFGWKSDFSQTRLGTRISFHNILCFVLSLIFAITVFAVRPPSFWYRLRASMAGDSGFSHNLVEELWEPLEKEHALTEGRQLVLFLSPTCEHCAHTISKINSLIKRNNSDTNRIHLAFMIVAVDPEQNPLLLPYFYEKAGIQDPGFDTFHVETEQFINMTNGLMPLICLFEEGKLIREYSYNNLDELFIAEFLDYADQQSQGQ